MEHEPELLNDLTQLRFEEENGETVIVKRLAMKK